MTNAVARIQGWLNNFERIPQWVEGELFLIASLTLWFTKSTNLLQVSS